MRMRRTAEDILEIGRDLIAVKKRLGHGKFLAWIDAEFGMTKMTAARFMQVAERFGKSDTVSGLEISQSALYLLVAPSTDYAVVAAAVTKGQAGEKIYWRIGKRLKAEQGRLSLSAKRFNFSAFIATMSKLKSNNDVVG